MGVFLEGKLFKINEIKKSVDVSKTKSTKKADLTEKEFEWLSRYSLAEEEVRKNMKISSDLLEKGISVEEYR